MAQGGPSSRRGRGSPDPWTTTTTSSVRLEAPRGQTDAVPTAPRSGIRNGAPRRLLSQVLSRLTGCLGFPPSTASSSTCTPERTASPTCMPATAKRGNRRGRHRQGWWVLQGGLPPRRAKLVHEWCLLAPPLVHFVRERRWGWDGGEQLSGGGEAPVIEVADAVAGGAQSAVAFDDRRPSLPLRHGWRGEQAVGVVDPEPAVLPGTSGDRQRGRLQGGAGHVAVDGVHTSADVGGDPQRVDQADAGQDGCARADQG